jgi:putrescine importer
VASAQPRTQSRTQPKTQPSSHGQPPTLDRTLGQKSLMLFGLSYMGPLTVLATFGVLAQKTHGAAASAVLVATVAMAFTAFSYGRMAAAFPVAGSAYTYARRMMGGNVGFLTGWAVLLDYFFIPMVIWLITATVINAFLPGLPIGLIVVFFILVSSVVNVLGIKVANGVNWVLTGFQVLIALVFAAFAFFRTSADHGATGLFSATPFLHSGTGLASIGAGAAVAVYSFLGFDAVTTLTEETKDPQRTMPRAILSLTLLGGLLFVVVAYAVQIVHPGAAFASPDAAANEVGRAIGGKFLDSLFTGGIVAGGVTCGIAAQASAARLLFAMGRDGVLPQRFFGRLHSRFHTPVGNICLIGVFGLLGVTLDIASSTSFINFGAFTAFVLVNLSALLLGWRNRHGATSGRRAVSIAVPLVGALIDLALFTTLDRNAMVLGAVWLALGVAYLAYLTRGFRRPAPETSFIDTGDTGHTGHTGDHMHAHR